MTGSFAILCNGDYKASKFLRITRTVTVMLQKQDKLVHMRCLVMGIVKPSKFLRITKYCDSLPYVESLLKFRTNKLFLFADGIS